VKIYAGNLSYSLGDAELREAFEEFGTVESAEVIMDRNTGRSKGFGFVEMTDDEEAKAAISGLNGKDIDGRPIKVDEARPKRTESRGGGGYRY
jgi:RNA recognition motif-containing protein